MSIRVELSWQWLVVGMNRWGVKEWETFLGLVLLEARPKVETSPMVEIASRAPAAAPIFWVWPKAHDGASFQQPWWEWIGPCRVPPPPLLSIDNSLMNDSSTTTWSNRLRHSARDTHWVLCLWKMTVIVSSTTCPCCTRLKKERTTGMSNGTCLQITPLEWINHWWPMVIYSHYMKLASLQGFTDGRFFTTGWTRFESVRTSISTTRRRQSQESRSQCEWYFVWNSTGRILHSIACSPREVAAYSSTCGCCKNWEISAWSHVLRSYILEWKQSWFRMVLDWFTLCLRCRYSSIG